VARSAQRISLWENYLVASSYAYRAHRRRYKDLPSAPRDRSSSVGPPRSGLERAEPAPALAPLRGSRIGGQEKMVTLQPSATLLPLPRSSIPNSLSTKNLRIDGFDGSVDCRGSASSCDFAPFQPQYNLVRATDWYLQAQRASEKAIGPACRGAEVSSTVLSVTTFCTFVRESSPAPWPVGIRRPFLNGMCPRGGWIGS